MIICDDLSNPDNGFVDQPSNSVGTVATYDCNNGFVIVGNDERTCQDNGEWSGEDPFCAC